jgi:DNA (cytosine-5-)-methyltransferase
MKPIRLETTSVDGTKINLEALYQIAPSCFTEKKDEKTGEIKRVVNFETLRQLLGGDAVDEDEEMYQFTWPGKRAARYEAAEPIDDTLRPVPADAVDWDTTENLYIEGDNLRVLKLLQRGYMGKVKMIYIDPPYNTGNDFVYHDDFAHSAEEEDLAAGNIDEEGYRYRRNLDSNGRFHSDWCSMMYSRLLVAHSLLKEDGVIFISIDDNEVHNLRKICDEVFGERNLVAEIPWQSRSSIQNDTDFSVNHEYILVYAKNRRKENRRLKESNKSIWYNRDSFVCSPIPLNISNFENPDNDPRGPWKADPFDAPNIRPNLTYPITNPNTGEQHLPPRGRHWRTDSKQYANALKDGRILFGKNGTGRPQLKVFYEEKKDFGSVDNSWFSAERIGTSTQGTKEQIKIFGGFAPFDTPKPLSLIYKLLQLANLRKDSLILDFFSGSATTAHAVMQLNAEDGGKRKYICVQLPEETPEGSEARKAGYNTIPEIAKERIRRSAKQILSELDIQLKKAYQVLYDSCGGAIESPNPSGLTYFINNATLEQRNKFDKAQQSYNVLKEKKEKLDTGFRVFRIDSGNYKDVTMQPNEYDQQMLDLFVDNIKADRTDLDLLFGAMLAWGVQLSLPMTTEEVDGCKIYAVDGNGLVACFAENISENVVQAMAAKQPLRVLFRDSCFDEDKTKINIFERFKQQLDWDEKEAIQNIRVV